MASSGRTPNYQLPFPLSEDPVDVSGDISLLANAVDTRFDGLVEDVIGAMVSGNTETGISITYQDDPISKLNFILDVDFVKDRVAEMLEHPDHIGIIAAYNTESRQIELEVTGGGSGGSGSGSGSLSTMWFLGV
jgi:hypothetical protein